MRSEPCTIWRRDMGGSRSWWSRPGNVGRGPRLLAILAATTFFQGYGTFALPMALPVIRHSLGLSLSGAGVVLAFVFAGALGSFVLLALADRWGRRPIFLVALVGASVTTFATAFSHGVIEFTALQFVSRAFLGAQFALATIILVETTEPLRR